MSNKRTHVQYVVSTLAETGPTRQLLNIVSNIDRDRYNPHIVTLSPEPEDSYKKSFEDNGIEVTSLGLSRIGGVVHGCTRLSSVTDKIDPDVIHTQGIRADSLVTSLFTKYPHLTTLRNYPPEDYIPRYGNILGRLMVWQQFRVVAKADRAVACSKTIQNKYRSHGVEGDVIRNGVDAEEFHPPSSQERRQARADLGIELNETVVVSVGALIQRKNPIKVIKGFQQSETSDRGVLFILGDGELMNKCQDLSSSSIQLPGHVNEVEKYLYAADVFVSASQSEGLPNAVMEALATGVPVCLSDIGPHREILSMNSESGELFQKYNTSSIARKIDSVANFGSTHRNAAREIVATELNATNMAKKYMSVYDSLKRS